MARIFPLDGQASAGLWWYSLLLYDLDDEGNCSLTPAQLSPPGLSGRGYLASQFGAPCEDGAAVASCTQAFSESAPPLPMATETSKTGRSTDIRLHHVAPVLPGGWVLLGEQTKFVAVSPQRFVAARVSASAMAATGASDALAEDELLRSPDGGGLFEFTVLGEPGESVGVAVVVPSGNAGGGGGSGGGNASAKDNAAGMMGDGMGVVAVVKVVVGASGRSEVECAAKPAGCRVLHAGARGSGAL